METIILTLQIARELIDIDANLNDEQFNPLALRVQRNNLKELLGSEFYYDICENIGNYTDLLEDYIYPYLTFAWGAKFIIEGSMFATNRGSFQFAQDTTQNPAKWQLMQISENYKQEQTNYENELITFLDSNRTTYPLWKADKSQNLNISFGII